LLLLRELHRLAEVTIENAIDGRNARGWRRPYVAHYLSQRLNGLGRHRARKLGNIERGAADVLILSTTFEPSTGLRRQIVGSHSPDD
jgi:hypothetical protein